MAKLYPPNINGTIPAFYGDNGTVLITVPFSMNRAVSEKEVGGFALKIKTVSGVVKGVIKTNNNKGSSYDMQESNSATFNASHLDFSVGQYYKFQLAYIGTDGVVGYYSTIGVAKYTTVPSVSISGLQFGRVNSHNYFYTGVYSQKGKDATEKLYSSRFTLYDANKLIIQDSGDVLHNATSDDLSYEAHATFSVPQDLKLDQTYYIKFSVQTINGLSKSTPYYRLVQRRSVSPEIKAELTAALRPDEGYIDLKILDTADPVISGAFLISRASSLNGFAWEEFKRFDLQSMVPSKWSLQDCTVAQGVTYKYSLQQYNASGIYSDRIISNAVTVDFEDMFLFDGDKQLNIRFNPKVSSYKINVLESKIDTIGSKHPFISRNGNVYYKEFPISGLISYHMDDMKLFMNNDELGLKDSDIDYNLTTANMTAERLFKNKVLDWLNNGKPKIFRSPTEGNFIVRLMNVSLSPNDTVSRMLHSFNCTAYEIADFTIDNLKHFDLVDLDANSALQTRWKTITLKDAGNKDNNTPPLLSTPAHSILFTEMMPGSEIFIGNNKILIGATGSYAADFKDSPIRDVSFKWEKDMPGLFTYSYKTRAITVFGTIKDIFIEDVPIRQFIGDSYKKQDIVDDWGRDFIHSNNIFDIIKDVKSEVLNAYAIKLYRRDIQYIYVNQKYQEGEEFNPEGQYEYYTTMYCREEDRVKLEDLDEWAIHYIRYQKSSAAVPFPNEGYYIEANNQTFAPYTGYAIDGMNKEIFKLDNDTFKAYINKEPMDLFDKIIPYRLEDSSFVNRLEINRGVVAELSYSKQVIEYIFEQNGGPSLLNAKKAYQKAEDALLAALNKGTPENKQEPFRPYIKQLQENRDKAYLLFVKELAREIFEYKEANGIIS